MGLTLMSILDNTREFIIKSLGGVTQEIIQPKEDTLEKGLSNRGVLESVPTSGVSEVSTTVNYNTLYRMYKQETWVRACVDTIRRGTLANGLDISPTPGFEDTLESNEEKLRHFLSYPNPEDSIEDIIGDVVADLQIYGDAYVEIVKDGFGEVRELWTLDASTMKVKSDNHGRVLGFTQTGDKGESVTFESDEVIHFKLASKGATVYGLSPLESLVRPIDTDLKAQIYIAKYFENFGAPKALFKFKNATPDQIRRNRLYLATQVTGVENAHRNLILEGDVDYQPLNTNMRDTETLKVRQFLRDEILAVYGVPPSKVSIIETGNIGGGSGDSQDKTFKIETIVPLQKAIAKKLNHKLVKGQMNIFDFEISFGDIIDINRKEEADVHKIYLDSGVLTKDEVREDLGRDPLDIETEGTEEGNTTKEDTVSNNPNKPDPNKPDPKKPEDDTDTLSKEEEKDVKEKAKKSYVTYATRKNLGIDFDRFEPLRERIGNVITSYAKQKTSKVKAKVEENA